MSHQLTPILAGLLEHAAYPHAVSGIELVQTHISWVFLTGEWAYKIKRPVSLPFADFRLLERRAFLCREELRLNRRFAPGIYRDVCPITRQAGAVRIDGQGEIVEYAVRMRQFAAEDQLDRLLASGSTEPAALREFGAALAAIHQTLPVASPTDPWGDPTKIREVFRRNLDELCEVAGDLVSGTDIEALRTSLQAHLASGRSLMAARRSEGRVRECHGDLHTRNIVRSGGSLVPFDCLEFEPSFRWIDVADEVAFLRMDLNGEYPAHAHEFLSGYLAASGDYEACRLVGLYSAHRALVRAKVMALSVTEASDGDIRAGLRARLVDYVARAHDSLRERDPRLLLMRGLSGSGKTWLASRLAPQLDAIHIRSDVERKRLAGLSELSDSGSRLGQDLYSERETARLYKHLVECAAHALAGGYWAIVDATFLRRSDRDRLRPAASGRGRAPILINCHAPRDLLRLRVAERGRTGRDASEADGAVLEYQARRAQTVAADESFVVIDADTTRPDIVSELLKQLVALRDTTP